MADWPSAQTLQVLYFAFSFSQALLDSSSGSPSSPTSAQTDLLSTTLDDSIWKNKPRLTSNSPLTPPYQRLSLQDIAASSSESDTEVATFTAASHP